MVQPGIPLDLAARLNAARRARGWSIREMAARCEISPDLAHQIFTGKQSPSATIAERLIERLGVDIDTAHDLRALGASRYVAAYGSTSIALMPATPDDGDDAPTHGDGRGLSAPGGARRQPPRSAGT